MKNQFVHRREMANGMYSGWLRVNYDLMVEHLRTPADSQLPLGAIFWPVTKVVRLLMVTFDTTSR